MHPACLQAVSWHERDRDAPGAPFPHVEFQQYHLLPGPEHHLSSADRDRERGVSPFSIILNGNRIFIKSGEDPSNSVVNSFIFPFIS